MVLLLLEIWLIYRAYCIQKANETTGLMKIIWTILTLGVTTYHPDSGKIDNKLSTILAGIGIPWAILLHGYVGFIFGSVKAIAWWATPLQPVIFILSAIVSGMVLLMLMYSFIMWYRQQSYDYHMIKIFMAYVWGVFMLAFAMEMLEVGAVIYESGWHWSQIAPLVKGPLYGTWVIGQVLVLSVIPLILLGYVVLSNISGKALLYLANLGNVMLLLQVLFMRYNVVIGGQLISKSERGFVTFHWELFGHEGIFTSLLILCAPFVAYYIISRFIPILNRS
jgi:Ni/Fe-hydrogenase subunit HybB-like protein